MFHRAGRDNRLLRTVCVLVGACMVFIGHGATALAGASVLNMRLGLHEDKTRFVLDLSEAVAFRAHALARPLSDRHRFPGARLANRARGENRARRRSRLPLRTFPAGDNANRARCERAAAHSRCLRAAVPGWPGGTLRARSQNGSAGDLRAGTHESLRDLLWSSGAGQGAGDHVADSEVCAGPGATGRITADPGAPGQAAARQGNARRWW
jgi:hypothetical protein